MTIEELEDYLAACGLRLDYTHGSEGYHWLVSQASDAAIPVAQGSDPHETAMIAHILTTPYQHSGALLGQVHFVSASDLRGHDD